MPHLVRFMLLCVGAVFVAMVAMCVGGGPVRPAEGAAALPIVTPAQAEVQSTVDLDSRLRGHDASRALPHPFGFRFGRRTSSPPQLGQRSSISWLQCGQKVHS